MEIFRITVLSLLLWMAYVPCVVTGLNPIYGKVGETVTLTCPKGEKITDAWRSWNRGSYDENNLPGQDKLIYKARENKTPLDGPMKRTDMQFDKSTFAMTFTVQDDTSDNDNFTCVTEDGTNLIDVQQVLIFFQPVVTIVTDQEPEEGVNVTITCSVERLYPNITSEQFTMRWDNQDANGPEFSGLMNKDGFMKYTLEKTKNLTRDDDGVMVECTVTPNRNYGEPATGSFLLNLTMGPEEPTDPGESTVGGSNVGAIVGGVIGGLAAVAIVVVIMVVILMKRKPKKDKATRQSAATGSRTKTNKPVTEGLMYAELDLVNQPKHHKVEKEGSQPPVTPRPVQEPTEYAQIDFDKLKIKNQRDEEDLTLSDKEDL